MASIDHPRLPAPIRVEGSLEVSSAAISLRIRFEAGRIVVTFPTFADLNRARNDLAGLQTMVAKRHPAAASSADSLELPEISLMLRRRQVGHIVSTPRGPEFKLTPFAFLFP